MGGKLKIKLVKSLITENPKARKTAFALGLRKMNKEVIHNDTPQIRGMIKRISHLVKVEEINQ